MGQTGSHISRFIIEEATDVSTASVYMEGGYAHPSGFYDRCMTIYSGKTGGRLSAGMVNSTLYPFRSATSKDVLFIKTHTPQLGYAVMRFLISRMLSH